MRILIAEDDAISRRLLETILRKWGYDVVVAHDGVAAWSVLKQPESPRLAILDWMMPGMDGIEVCHRIRERGSEVPYVYVLLLTARIQREDLLHGMEAGADDYVTKPFDANELKVRLRAGRRILDLQEQLMSAQEALKDQAARDPLTGILNRTAIFQVLEREISRSEREGAPLSVIMVDIDHFKRFNDTYGHLAGDAVLRETVRRMGGSIRNYDAIGRYGGEEFLIVLPGCDAESARGRADRLRQVVATEAFDTSEGRIVVTCSLGVGSLTGGRSSTPDDLIRAADNALYRAKNAGRNCVEIESLVS